MKNKYWIVIIIIILLIGAGIFFFFNNNSKTEENQTSNYEANKTQANINTSQNNTSNENSTNTENESQVENENINKEITPPKEDEIASFSTKILTKDSNRQKNISITCSTLNDKLVENGATFSFCNTVGPSTSAKGYEKADIFDANRKKEKRTWWRKLPSKYYFI